LFFSLLIIGCLPVQSQTTGTKKVVDTAVNQLAGVLVSASKPAFERLADKLVVNVAGNRLFKAAANAFDILKKIPGLEVGGDGALLLSGRITPGVFINGKPVPMSAEELQNYLASLSPDMIASIEVIANPSSRYDGEYKGIIDIKLKQDLLLGWKGNISTNLQRNAFTTADNNFLLTYKTKRWTYTTRIGYMAGIRNRTYDGLQHLASTNIMTTHTEILTNNNNINYQLGVAYDIQKDHRLELGWRMYRVNRVVSSYNTLHTTDAAAANVISNTASDNIGGPVQDNYAANLNYTGQIGKTQLQIISSFVKISNWQKEDIQNRNTLTAQLLDYWKTALQNEILIRSVQADLSGNLGKGKWSAGTKFVLTTTQNNLRYDTLNSGSQFVPDSSRTNHFYYKEYITAGYLSYERKLKQWSLDINLRAEHTHSIANAITAQQVTERNYLTWLPGFRLTYTINKSRQVNFSYTRRITRPNFAQLNPFRFYNSPLNYWVGNPYLQPSTTRTLSVSYSQKAFTVSLTAGKETDPMTRYPEYNRTTNVLEYLGKNLPYNHFANIETSFPFSFTKWWRMSHNLGLYYQKEPTPYHGSTYAIPITHYSISGTQVFTLPAAFTLDVYYRYRSVTGNGLYIMKQQSNIDLGLHKTWLKGKLSTTINYYDIFNAYVVAYIFREKSIIDNEFVHWFGTQRVSLTVNYSFGKSTYKARQTNKNEEEGRAGM
jgi:outer membrane receptor protein involved in Fe transport